MCLHVIYSPIWSYQHAAWHGLIDIGAMSETMAEHGSDFRHDITSPLRLANTRYWAGVGLMLGQRRRCWANIKSKFCQYFDVFWGYAYGHKNTIVFFEELTLNKRSNVKNRTVDQFPQIVVMFYLNYFSMQLWFRMSYTINQNNKKINRNTKPLAVL